jgi:indolepyruvate ferredoxin oxidoreductase
MHNLSAMGQGGALGAGMDMFTTNPSVVLMGDSTFFHSGMTDISNSVQSGHDITYILLDNDNTAMTGHQMTQVSGVSVEGYKRPRQDMLPIVKNLGVDEVFEVNPSDRYFYKSKLLETVKKSGTKVIISNKECGLTFHGRRKSKERKLFSQSQPVKTQKFYQINTDVCEDCRECVEMTGCPGLSQTKDAYGTKVSIDPQICVADSYCTKLKACPSFELVEVANFHPSKYKKSKVEIEGLDDLPLPKSEITFDQLAGGAHWRTVVTGVGGSGVTTISRVLAEAAKEMDGRSDLDFKFVDQKGLAQRNGRVTGHMAIFKKGSSYGAITPQGTADLLLSPDLLDGSQAINFLSKEGKAIIDTNFQIPLSILLDYGEEGEPLNKEEIRKKLEEKLGDRVTFSSLKQICKELVGKSVYASGMILGIAFQSGRLPFTLSNMRKAFEDTIYAEELDNNWLAFNLGRKAYLEGDELFFEHYIKEDHYDLEAHLVKSINDSFLPWQNKKYFVELFDRFVSRLKKAFPEIDKLDHMQYIHDQIIYNRGVKLEEFIHEAGMISINYTNESDRKVALRTLAKCFFVKDEAFVSHQMLSSMQKYREEQLYGQVGTGYKKTHLNRPGFMILGKHFEFDISPKDWMLKIARHMRIFRVIMSAEHEKEMKISRKIREELLKEVYLLDDSERAKRLVQLDNIKGYRKIRYEKAEKVLGAF